MHYCKGNPSRIAIHLPCSIYPKWVPFNDPCSTPNKKINLTARKNRTQTDAFLWWCSVAKFAGPTISSTLFVQELRFTCQNAWKKLQIYSPDGGLKMVIYYGRMHTKIINKNKSKTTVLKLSHTSPAPKGFFGHAVGVGFPMVFTTEGELG